MRLPDEMLKSLVFLGKRDEDADRIHWGGTAFFLSVPSKRIPNCNHVLLVSAKHNADALLGEDFYIRFNTREGRADKIKVPATERWVQLSDQSVDWAVLRWRPPKEADFLCLPKQMIWGPEYEKTKGIGIGDEVYITGLFTFVTGIERNEPIVRMGSLAMIPRERVPISNWPTESMEAYLIESRSIAGLSGSPVLVQRSIKVQATEETGREPLAAGAIFLLGLVHGHWDIPKRKHSKGNGDESLLAADQWGEEVGDVNVGIAIVAPASKLLDLLAHRDVMAYLDELDRQELARLEGRVVWEGPQTASVTVALSANPDFGLSRRKP